MRLKGRVWVFGDNIDTDTIYPAKAFTLPEHEKARMCMESIRPGWSLKVRSGDIIIAGHNFGTGSSRPASRILRMLGIQAVLAESVSPVFLRNSINYGLPCLECPGVSDSFSEGEIALVDLNSFTVENISRHILLRCHPLPEIAVRILESGGLLGYLNAVRCIG